MHKLKQHESEQSLMDMNTFNTFHLVTNKNTKTICVPNYYLVKSKTKNKTPVIVCHHQTSSQATKIHIYKQKYSKIPPNKHNLATNPSDISH